MICNERKNNNRTVQQKVDITIHKSFWTIFKH